MKLLSDYVIQERERDELQALGMKSNVAEMTKSLASMRKNARDDTSVIEALRADASKMKDDLTLRLSEYNNILEHNSDTTAVSIQSTLTEIKSIIVKMKLAQDEAFLVTMDSFGISMENDKSSSKLQTTRKTWGEVN